MNIFEFFIEGGVAKTITEWIDDILVIPSFVLTTSGLIVTIAFIDTFFIINKEERLSSTI